jgi:hypothetical protein
MRQGWTGKLLGAAPTALAAYEEMTKSHEWQHPIAWTKDSFTLRDYELVFLTGGHEERPADYGFRTCPPTTGGLLPAHETAG